jgi:hypothetical protein
MKKQLIITISLLLFMLIPETHAAISESPYNSDASFSAAIIGCWAANYSERILSMSGVTCYYEDGKAEMIAEANTGENNISISIKGTWQIANRKLISIVTETNQPHILPIGDISTDYIMSISTDKMILISDDGDELIRDRVKELKIPAPKHDTPKGGN